MVILEAMAFLGALSLLYVVSLSLLSVFSKVLAQRGMSLEARRSREGTFLMGLAFLSTLALLVWRVV